MTPPRNPFLRAIWRVGQCDDLTPLERITLLALWRYLGGDRKPIGPSLVASLIWTSATHAKSLMRRLREKGYIGSDGRRGNVRRWTANRWITKKAQLPRPRGLPGPRSKNDERGLRRPRDGANPTGPMGAGLRGLGRPNDGPVGRTDSVVRSAPSATNSGVEQVPEEKCSDTRPEETLYDVADIMSPRGSEDA